MKIGDRVKVKPENEDFGDCYGAIKSDCEDSRWDWWVTLDLTRKETWAFKESCLEII